MSDERTAAAWFERVEDDEQAARILLDEDGPPSVIVFHCQQMAEKSLKAVLVSTGREMIKIHDLVELRKKVREIAPDVDTLTAELDALKPFYIPTRYPGDYPELTADQAAEALVAAQKVKAFALKQTELDE